MSALWFCTVVLFFMFLQAKYYDRAVFSGFSYRRRFSRRAVFEGERVEMVEELYNRKLTPVPWLRVESRISPNLRFQRQENLDIDMEQYHKSVFFLGGFRKITRRHEIICAHRGFYRLSQTSVTAGDLFGMTRRFMDLSGGAELFVYPRIPDFHELPPEAVRWQGEFMSRRFILPDPMLVNGIREYRSGDAQKDIHWGATAKTGRLKVKTHDYTVCPRLLVALNAQISEDLWALMDGPQREVIEEGVRCCASLLNWAVSQGTEAGFLCNGTLADAEGETVFIAPSASEAHRALLLDTLARLIVTRRLNFHTLLDRLCDGGAGGLDIVIVSAYRSGTLDACAERLRQNGNTVSFVPIRRPEA